MPETAKSVTPEAMSATALLLLLRVTRGTDDILWSFHPLDRCEHTEPPRASAQTWVPPENLLRKPAEDTSRKGKCKAHTLKHLVA